jgi:hypothetical protein
MTVFMRLPSPRDLYRPTDPVSRTRSPAGSPDSQSFMQSPPVRVDLEAGARSDGNAPLFDQRTKAARTVLVVVHKPDPGHPRTLVDVEFRRRPVAGPERSAVRPVSGTSGGHLRLRDGCSNTRSHRWMAEVEACPSRRHRPRTSPADRRGDRQRWATKVTEVRWWRSPAGPLLQRGDSTATGWTGLESCARSGQPDACN